MTNEERCLAAERSLRASPGFDPEDIETSMVDLLADLMHLANRDGQDWEELTRRGRVHFEAELKEEDP